MRRTTLDHDMPDPIGSPTCLSSVRDGRGLRVEFVWSRDRFSHRVVVVERSGESVCLESEEGNDQQSWPPSPALQQLSAEVQTGGPVVLMVGMAGTSHWSLSVEADPDQRCLVFDVACRVREEGLLGSRYRACKLPAGFANPRIEVDHGLGTRQQSQTGEGRWVGPPVGIRLPATLRWKYQLFLDDPAD